MAKKEIKTQTIEEILADHTPTSEAVKSAVQRYNEDPNLMCKFKF